MPRLAKAGPAELAGLASSFLVTAVLCADLEVGYVHVGLVARVLEPRVAVCRFQGPLAHCKREDP